MAASCDLLDVVPPVLQFQCQNDKPQHLLRASQQGIIAPRSSCMVEVTKGVPKVSYGEFQCKDKFLVQSAVVSDSDHSSAKDITSQIFTKGNAVGEVKLMVYVMPPEQTSEEIAERHDDSVLSVPPMQQIVNNGRSTSENSDLSSGSMSWRSAEMGTVVGIPIGQSIQLPLLSSLDVKLSEGKTFVLEQNRDLREELELLRHEVNRWTLILVVGLLVIILGYLTKN